jgi:hypothetical protein
MVAESMRRTSNANGMSPSLHQRRLRYYQKRKRRRKKKRNRKRCEWIEEWEWAGYRVCVSIASVRRRPSGGREAMERIQTEQKREGEEREQRRCERAREFGRGAGRQKTCIRDREWHWQYA